MVDRLYSGRINHGSAIIQGQGVSMHTIVLAIMLKSLFAAMVRG